MSTLDAIAAEREKWRSFPRVRPSGVVVPGPGQESVWDYPRPPRVESVSGRVKVEFRGRVLAETSRALRVCETASPPTYYIPPADVEKIRAADPNGVFHVYPADHGFNCDERAAFDAASAQLARERTLEFLVAHLEKKK